MKKFYHLLLSFVLLGFLGAYAQTGVLNPADPVVTYNPASPPATPGYGVLAKWVKTTRVNWNTSSYKCYYYNGLQFRLKFPKSYQHGVADGKKYPMIIFFHGLGEKGTIYDNEYQLYHGGELHKNAVDNGTFDGFLLYPQNTGGYFGAAQYDIINALINNYFVPQIKLDIDRIIVNGLSAGGSATWEFLMRYPKLTSSALPISASSGDYKSSVTNCKFIPIWLFQGGTDGNPTPSTSQDLYNYIANTNGGNMRYREYAGKGHGVWYDAWGESDYWPTANRAHKANPWPLTGRTEFCPGDPINVTIGMTPGFDGYEWRKDGNVIAGATGNTITATAIGTYDVRFRRGSTWSVFSPIPVVIKLKTPTVPPAITVNPALSSKVIPSPDGKTSVTLEVPAGYAAYAWKRTSAPNTVIGTANQYAATTPGEYTVQVTEQYGCASANSPAVTVINANGPNAPSPANNVAGTALSKTSVEVTWSENPNPAFQETAYEVYQSTSAGTGYKLVGITAANTTSFTVNQLNAGTKYYYIIRATNNTAASALSNEASVTTLVDDIKPTAPGNLRVTASGKTSVALAWDASTDDVGVVKYDVYVNGTKSYTVNADQTNFVVYGLINSQTYSFTVKARDLTGNNSPFSNQAVGTAKLNGLLYKYYQGTWSNLPDFNTLTPIETGQSATTDLSVRNVEDRFALLWEGYINIPVSGNYTFETYSDDGSKLYIGQYSHTATALVNNDGAHGTQYREGTIYLTAGSHPIAITYFEATGGQTMQVYWKNTAHGVNSRQQIPASAFTETVPLPGTPPAVPSNLKVTPNAYDRLNLTWTDNSNNETGFEIYRSATLTGTYQIVATVPANTTAYTDTLLSPQTTYYYKLKAINGSGDSGFNLVEYGGLFYKYYERTGMTSLPNFASLTPAETGNVTTPSLSIRNRNDNFAIQFLGYITVPTTGSYTFFTSSDAGSKLYIGTYDAAGLVVSNDHTSGTVERSGTKTLTANVSYPIFIDYFEQTGSENLTVRYQGPSISKRDIPSSLYINNNVYAQTLALPTAPLAPTTLVATPDASSSIKLTWVDNATNETAYEVYRSSGNNSNFRLQATLQANTTTFTDTALFANLDYFYKVRARNVGGISGYSNEASSQTLNAAPVFTSNLIDRTMRYGNPLNIQISATDAEGENISFSGANLPAFAQLTDNGNGTATLSLTPGAGTEGTYANIQVLATDGRNQAVSQSFTLIVNDNYLPVLSAINNTTLAENATANINLSVSDENAGETFTWAAQGLPSFATLTPNGGNAAIALAPGYADNGNYNVTLTVTDSRGGIDMKSFSISVTDVNPNKQVRINFNGQTTPAPAPWNSTSKRPVQGDVFADLKDANNAGTGINMTITTAWQQVYGGDPTNTLGVNTYNNTGVYPDLVISTAWLTEPGKPQTMKFSNLSPNYKYNFTFFCSRLNTADTRTSLFTIGNQSVSQVVNGNSQNTVSINNVLADANGEVFVTFESAPGSQYGYMNAMVLDMTYDDGAVPAKPRDVATELIPAGVKVNWTDAAFNETGYEIYRAGTQTGTYTLQATTAANAVTWTDVNVNASAQYWYAVRAINAAGASAFSDSVGITAANRNPAFTFGDQTIKSDTLYNFELTANDDPSDVITFSATGLPSFATLTNNGNGTASLQMNATNGQVGQYNNIVITASDDKGGSTSQTIKLIVRDKNLVTMYVQFNEVDPAPAPWNAFNGFPVAGRSITNIKDDAGAATGVSVTLVDAFTASNTVGAVTGNNSGIYPDLVMRSFYYEETTTAKRIRLSGLNPAMKYNLVFFGSRTGVNDNRNTTYTVGAQSVTLNAASNTSNTVQINGLSPDANGQITYDVRRAAGSNFAYMGALVIQAYVDNGLPLSPTNLSAVGKSRSSIDLTWADKSSNEIGFEIWRSTSQNGTYTLINTTAANAAAYTDNGLVQGTQYYYKVRAKVSAALLSDYSNIATAGTMASAVHINMTVTQLADAPWNNTAALPYQGLTMDALKDDAGNGTNTVFTVTRNFTGTNPGGANTGNNSGIYPDKVMMESYYTDLGDTAKMVLSNLNLSYAYTLEFFSSRDGVYETRAAAFVVNGKIVTLDARNNRTTTVKIEKIMPNENGEIEITMYSAPGSQWGYLNSLVIQAFPNMQDGGSGGGGSQFTASISNDARIGSPAVTKASIKNDHGMSDKNELIINNAYPNPFKQDLYLSVTRTGKSAKVSLMLYDVRGQLIYNRLPEELSAGTHLLKITPKGNIPTGVYFLQILADQKPVKTVRIVKQ